MSLTIHHARVMTMTGARELTTDDVARVSNGMHEVMFELCPNLTVFRFGGARGADSVALSAVANMLPELLGGRRLHCENDLLYRVTLEIVVPSKLMDQPTEARSCVERTLARFRHVETVSVRVIELEHQRFNHQRYQARNVAMLDGLNTCHRDDPASWPTDVLVSFWHGRPSGGTFNTICAAAQRRLPHVNFPVEGVFDDE